MINIEDILPVYKVENNCILSRQGDITIAYKLELPDIFTLSGQEYEALHHAWLKAIKVLPKHSIVHKQDIFIRAGYQGKPEHSASFLAEASETYFEGRAYLEHSCYILLTKQPGNRKAALACLFTLTSYLYESGLADPEALPVNLILLN